MPEPISDPKEVHVSVVLHKDGDEPPFHFETTDLPLGPNNVLTFINDEFPGFIIHYDLDDTLNPGFRFPDEKICNNLAEAIYVQARPGCPSGKSKWPQFWPMEVTPNGKTLIVRNENRGQVNFGYTLRVTKNGGGKYLDLDPGGDNKNGPIAPFVSSWIATALTGAIVGLGTIVLSSNSFVPATSLTFAIGGAVVGLVVGLLLGRR